MICRNGQELLAEIVNNNRELLWYSRCPLTADGGTPSLTDLQRHPDYAGIRHEILTGMLKSMMRVEVKAPDAVQALTCSEVGGWNRGFAAGVVATGRLALDLLEGELPDEVLARFPDLDT